MKLINWLFLDHQYPPMVWRSFFMFLKRPSKKGAQGSTDDCFKIVFEARPRMILSTPSLAINPDGSIGFGKPFNTSISSK
jgi:hypothetical protein